MIIIVKTPSGNKVRTIDTSLEPAVILFSQEETKTVAGMHSRGDDILTTGPSEEMNSPNKQSPFHKWTEEARKILMGMVKMSKTKVPTLTPTPPPSTPPPPALQPRKNSPPLRMPTPQLVESTVEIPVVPAEPPAPVVIADAGVVGSRPTVAAKKLSDAEILSIVDDKQVEHE